ARGRRPPPCHRRHRLWLRDRRGDGRRRRGGGVGEAPRAARGRGPGEPPAPVAGLATMNEPSPALVMVCSQFPEPNETFIVREVAELRRRGFAVTVLSLRPPPPRILDPEARALLPHVVYPPGRAVSVLRA